MSCRIERGRKSPLFLYLEMEKNDISRLIDEYPAKNDLFVVDIKLSPSRLAVYVDTPSGIKLDECSALSRYLAGNLEKEGFLENHEMEVSSPGMDMPLIVHQQ